MEVCHRLQNWPLALSVGCYLSLSGCGEPEVRPFTVFPVDGQLLIHNKPAQGTMVNFHRLDAQDETLPKLWCSVVKNDGHFVPLQDDGAVGLPPGKYALTLDFPDLPENEKFKSQYSAPDKPVTTIVVKEGINFLPPINLK